MSTKHTAMQAELAAVVIDNHPLEIDWKALTVELDGKVIASMLREYATFLSRQPEVSEEDVARLFHDEYERLAPSFGYETREETRVFDAGSANGKLMIAVCRNMRSALQSVRPPVGVVSGASVVLKNGTVVIESSLIKVPDGEYQLVRASSSINKALHVQASRHAPTKD